MKTSIPTTQNRTPLQRMSYRIKSQRGQQILTSIAFMIIPLLLLFIFTYLPFGQLVKFSFYDMKYLTPPEARKFVGWANYLDVFKRSDIFGALKLSLFYCAAEKIYNPELHRQEVFFDADYHSLIDLHSYGHDIETSWLLDRTLQVLDDAELSKRITPITSDLARMIYAVAFDGHSVANECENGIVNEHRVWWVQAEAIVGFLNEYQKNPQQAYLDAADAVWEFVKKYVIDRRDGSEWYWEVNPVGKPYPDRPIVEPWKCPYHNGRMCMEVMQRLDGYFSPNSTCI